MIFRRIGDRHRSPTRHEGACWKSEQVEAEEKAVRYVAKAADGSMRDALSLLDQCIAFYLGQKLTYDHVLEVLGRGGHRGVQQICFGRLLRGDVPGCIRALDELVIQGRELGQFVYGFYLVSAQPACW